MYNTPPKMPSSGYTSIVLLLCASAAPIFDPATSTVTVDEGFSYLVSSPESSLVYSTTEHWGAFEIDGSNVKFAVYALPNGTVVEHPPSTRGPGTHVAKVSAAARPMAVVPFFPGCYPNDDAVHVMNVTVVLDKSLASATLSDVERVVSVARVVFLSQLNVRIRIQTVERLDWECDNAVGDFYALNEWNGENKWRDTAYRMMLSKCFSGITGVAYVGSVCSSQNAGVAFWDWLDFAHEMGHALGALHTFGRGGIMDYSNGVYDGSIQMYPGLRADVCPYLAYAVPRCTKHVGVQATGCGDGVLGEHEECECVEVGKTKCGSCVDCKTKAKCSSEFAVRRDSGPPYAAEASNPTCCPNETPVNKPKTKCSGVDVCSGAACVQVCSRGFGKSTEPCGFDEMGCKQGCAFNKKCRWDLTMFDGSHLSHVPNGTRCVGGGVCLGGECSKPACSTFKKRGKCPPTYCKWTNRKCALK